MLGGRRLGSNDVMAFHLVPPDLQRVPSADNYPPPPTPPWAPLDAPAPSPSAPGRQPHNKMIDDAAPC